MCRELSNPRWQFLAELFPDFANHCTPNSQPENFMTPLDDLQLELLPDCNIVGAEGNNDRNGQFQNSHVYWNITAMATTKFRHIMPRGLCNHVIDMEIYSKKRQLLPNITLMTRTRSDKGKRREKGNNAYCRRGGLRCQECRNRNVKVCGLNTPAE